MARYSTQDHPDENTGVDFFAPKGRYELYFSELEVQEKNGNKFFGGKVVFMDGPRGGKYFFHTFWIFNPDKEKREKAETWLCNFFRAIGVDDLDPEVPEDVEKMINKTFLGDVDVEEYEGKKRNRLLPWGFHKVGGDASDPKAQPSAPQSSGRTDQGYQDDIPF